MGLLLAVGWFLGEAAEDVEVLGVIASGCPVARGLEGVESREDVKVVGGVAVVGVAVYGNSQDLGYYVAGDGKVDSGVVSGGHYMDGDDVAIHVNYRAAAAAGFGYGAGLQHFHAAAGIFTEPAAFGYSPGGDGRFRALQLSLGVSQGPYRSFRSGRVDEFQGIYSGGGK